MKLQLRQLTIRQGKPFLEIADDLGDIHQAYAEMLLKRYKENPRSNFITENDPKEMRAWIIGQRLFQSFLNQWRIPYIHDEPVFKFECERIVPDFIIPKFGSVEIKTRPWLTDTMIIKKSPWDYYVRSKTIPDYVVVLKLKSEENVAQIVGYEHGAEIDKLPNAPDICIYSPCYSKLYSKLHDFTELADLLKRCSLNPELCNASSEQ